MEGSDSFSARELGGTDRWEYRTEADVPYTTVFSTTNVGTPTYKLRWRIVGRQCFFQASIDSSTTIATTAGTSYMVLPVAAAGVSGMAVMSDAATAIAIGTCHINVTLSRCYLPTQAANANEMHITGWYEV
jgi:hypothetical protein